jgi:hypothetical protein
MIFPPCKNPKNNKNSIHILIGIDLESFFSKKEFIGTGFSPVDHKLGYFESYFSSCQII